MPVLEIENPLKEGVIFKNLEGIKTFKKIAERICHDCKEQTLYDFGDYDECPCGYTTKEKLFSDMTPEEVLDRIEAGEIPYENSELEAA